MLAEQGELVKCHYKNAALVTNKLAGECCCSVMEGLKDFCHMEWEAAVGGSHELSSDDQLVLPHSLGQYFKDRAL